MRRDPFLHWLLAVATLGQYTFLWGFRLARDANALVPNETLRVKSHGRPFLIGYIAYMVIGLGCYVGFDFDPRLVEFQPAIDGAFTLIIGLGFGLTAYFLWLLVRIARLLRYVSGNNTPRSGLAVFLFFLWATALPYLQGHLNTLLRQRAKAQAAMPQPTPA